MKSQSQAKAIHTTRVITAHIPSDLAERVNEYAERVERSKGWIVKQALKAWIEEEELRHQMTLEALAEADAGHVVPHGEIEKWAKSLRTGKPLRPQGNRISK